VVTDIYVVPFCKSALVMCNNSANARNMCLVSDSTVMLHESNIGNSFGYLDTNLVTWDSVQIPVIYLAENWPIRVCFVSKLTLVCLAE
jgi:hypothetical protein